MFRFANDGAHDEWFKARGGLDMMGFIDANGLAIARCLESALVVDIREYKSLIAAFEGMPEAERDARIQKFNDQKRSSMNDICGYAHYMAEFVRKKYKLPALAKE